MFDMLGGGNGNINLINFIFHAVDGSVADGTLVADEGGDGGSVCTVTGHVLYG